ncbi:MAG: PEGA domain-containing protein [Deltaproteobacteria bacterium]|nr:PEGA domain-containing protein [Deltaproteobacteria bacterium]
MTGSGQPGSSGPAEAGSTIGGYRVLRPCPVGEQDEPCFLVWDPASRQQAVLQTHPSTPPEGRKILLARLQNDADVSAALAHPGVVRVLGVGTDPVSGPFLVREFVDGPSLRALPHMEVDLQAALSILIQAAHALVAADAAAVAPRNLRLEHLFITRSGQVKVTVFGRPHITPPAPATSAYDLARVGLELITGQDPFPAGEAQGAPRIPVALDKGLTSAFTRALSPSPESRFPGLIPFVQVLVAEAPLSEEIRAELLELSDRTDPILGEACVAAWARDVWREGQVPTSTPVPEQPAGLPLASPPTLRLVTEPPGGASAPPLRPPAAAAPPPATDRAPGRAAAPVASPAPVVPDAARASGTATHPPPRPRRSAAWIALTVAAAALTAGAWFTLSGRPRMVEVVTAPPGAQVRLGGRLLGNAPLRVAVPREGGSVVLSLEGFLPREAAFRPGEERLEVALQPVPPPPPPPPPEPAPQERPPEVPAGAAAVEAAPPAAVPAPEPMPEKPAEPKAARPAKAKAKPARKAPAKPPPRKGFDLFQHLQKESERG